MSSRASKVCNRHTDATQSLAARLVLWPWLLLLASACHDFRAHVALPDAGTPGACAGDAQCGDAMPACPSGGTCDEAGLPIDCSMQGPTRRDCDHSTLTHCESDIAYDPVSCGGCDMPCTGMCAGGSCSAVEHILSAAALTRDGIAFTTDDIYALAQTQDQGTDLRVVSKSHPSDAKTLLTGLDGTWHNLVLGNSRLYMLDRDRQLRSVSLNASELPRDEGIANVEDYAIEHNVLYWHDGSSFQRKDLATGVISVLFQRSDSDTFNVDWASVAVNPHTIALGRSSNDHYEVRFFNQDGAAAGRVTGEGVIERLLPVYLGDLNNEVFAWIQQRSYDKDGGVWDASPDHPDSIVRHIAGGAVTRFATNGATLKDFAVDRDYIYYAWDDGHLAALTVVPRVSPASAKTAGLRAASEGMLLDGTCGIGTLGCSVYFTEGINWWRMARNDLLR